MDDRKLTNTTTQSAKPKRREQIRRTRPFFAEDIEQAATPKSTRKFSGSSPSVSGAISKLTVRMPQVKEKKEKKQRERWILTRKTWKYMTDAGRKLIPEGAQNRPEDLPKIERHFHHICSNEPRFILWRRKASYPGAMGVTRHSKRRLKLAITRSHKHIGPMDEFEEEARNADHIIDMLQSYLKIDESRKTTMLLGSKTVRPDQTSSPSAQRPTTSAGSAVGASSSRGPGFMPALPAQQKPQLDSAAQIQVLLDRLKAYTQSMHTPATTIPLDRITPDILEDKALLKRIYNELKKQQLHRILSRHSTPLPSKSMLPHSTSLTLLWHSKQEPFGGRNSPAATSPTAVAAAPTTNTTTNTSLGQANLAPVLGATGGGYSTTASTSMTTSPTTTIQTPAAIATTMPLKPRKKPPSTLKVTPTTTQIPVISVKKPSVEKHFNTCGTQTTFVGYNELQRLSKEHAERKREEAMYAVGGTGQTDDESEKALPSSAQHSRRKSSIDNEDVSQSVSDTIKRYLRMARKKSVHDDGVNRFKRVNYDRNLRNIRAKGEINPPGMDEDNSKATQTLDAWATISLEFIRGNENSTVLEEAHNDWKKSLDQRIQNKLDFEEKMRQKEHSTPSESAPTSPTQASQPQSAAHTPTSGGPGGLIHSGTQFFSNLWHGSGPHQHQSPPDNGSAGALSTSNSTCSMNSVAGASSANCYSQQSWGNNKGKDSGSDMQKSKSSSNVGQFVSKKIWKSRIKSPAKKPEWTPQGDCTWSSSTGRRVVLSGSSLFRLTEVERKTLHRVAIDKINQLNIGVSVVAPPENGLSRSSKTQKRRPLLIKRKALTTSFFDNSSSKEDKGVNGASGGGKVFGITLEKCLDNEQKSQGATANTGGDRGSRNSIISLLSGGASTKGAYASGSCESLPSHSLMSASTADNISSCLINRSAGQLSLSQSNIRRGSQEEDDHSDGQTVVPPPMAEPILKEPQVPAFVAACIAHLEEFGVNKVGIFRLGTSKTRVMKLKEYFDRGDITSLDPEMPVHDIATILKEYFRELPEPLLCSHLYKAFIKTQKIRNRRLQLEALSHLVQLLPIAHRDTLYKLLQFLATVARSSDDVTTLDGMIVYEGNRMDSSNLATVFAPNILWSVTPGQSAADKIGEQIDVINVIRTMIDHYEELFKVPAEIMDEIYTNMIDTFPQQLNYLCDRREVITDIDDFENASSGTGTGTALNSPPSNQTSPTSDVMRQQIFNKFVDSPTSAVAQSVPRRIYSREDVMHENTAAKMDPNGMASGGERRRERTSKMKYVESDQDMVRRRRRGIADDKNLLSQLEQQLSDISANRSKARTSSTSSTGTTDSHTSRRLSSPYVLDKTGVVTASLKIPVQMQSTGVGSELGGDASRRLDFSDIPYIEDAFGGLDIDPESNASMPGVSSGSNRKPEASSQNTYKIPISYEGRILNLPQQQQQSSSTSLDSAKLSSFQAASTDVSPSPSSSSIKSQQPVRPSRSGSTNRNSITGIALGTLMRLGGAANEPQSMAAPSVDKVAPSISKIGGAVMRSKTADFERMSENDSNVPRSISTTVILESKKKSTSGADTKNGDNVARRPSQGPIYKRTELISSAKRVNK